MADPRIWTPQELRADAEEATAIFRKQRLDEPLELYSDFFQAFVPVFNDIIDLLPNLAAPDLDPQAVAELVSDDDVRTAFRYLAAPPISEDDLKTLAETTLSARALRDPAQALRVRDIVLHIIDPHRFPWIDKQRSPKAHEREQAVVASAALVATQKMATYRRTDAKDVQESQVKEFLTGIGFTEVPRRDILLLEAAPAPGEFCGESMLGDTRADLVVRLYDRRAMPIECKASNSSVNSVKRLNREAAGKAAAWLAGFGKRQTVPAAVLSGVFNSANLETAQADGLALFWSHRLQDLAEYVEATR